MAGVSKVPWPLSTRKLDRLVRGERRLARLREIDQRRRISRTDAHARGRQGRELHVYISQSVARAFEIAGEMAKNPDPQLRMIKELLGRNGTDTDLGTVQERAPEPNA